MLWRMIRGALLRQWSKMLLIALTIALGASLATSMINVMPPPPSSPKSTMWKTKERNCGRPGSGRMS